MLKLWNFWPNLAADMLGLRCLNDTNDDENGVQKGKESSLLRGPGGWDIWECICLKSAIINLGTYRSSQCWLWIAGVGILVNANKTNTELCVCIKCKMLFARFVQFARKGFRLCQVRFWGHWSWLEGSEKIYSTQSNGKPAMYKNTYVRMVCSKAGS